MGVSGQDAGVRAGVAREVGRAHWPVPERRSSVESGWHGTGATCGPRELALAGHTQRGRAKWARPTVRQRALDVSPTCSVDAQLPVRVVWFARVALARGTYVRPLAGFWHVGWAILPVPPCIGTETAWKERPSDHRLTLLPAPSGLHLLEVHRPSDTPNHVDLDRTHRLPRVPPAQTGGAATGQFDRREEQLGEDLVVGGYRDTR